jgi:hypothetical protein
MRLAYRLQSSQIGKEAKPATLLQMPGRVPR